MHRLLILAVLLQLSCGQQYQQKVAPGVPPQNYQNYQQPPPPPPPQQQYQPPPPQQQQYQPPPPQQQQYQPPPPQQQQYQQPGHGQDHGHHGDPQLLNPANIAQERDHIQEHIEVPIDTSKMSEQELQFHYFKMHDADNNNKLDGCELIKSLIHWHAEQGHKQEQPQTGSPPVGDKIFQDEELVNLIDPILNMDDHNRDGYIDYPEFIRAQQKQQSQNKEGQIDKTNAVYTDEQLATLTDTALNYTDFNNDGYVDYLEYRINVYKARAKAYEEKKKVEEKKN